jgi:hypothetical protein
MQNHPQGENTLRVGSLEGEAAAVAGTVAKGPSLVVAIQRQAGMANEIGDEFGLSDAGRRDRANLPSGRSGST